MKIMEILIQIEPSKDSRLHLESYLLMKDSDTGNLSTLSQGSPGRRVVLGRSILGVESGEIGLKCLKVVAGKQKLSINARLL